MPNMSTQKSASSKIRFVNFLNASMFAPFGCMPKLVLLPAKVAIIDL